MVTVFLALLAEGRRDGGELAARELADTVGTLCIWLHVKGDGILDVAVRKPLGGEVRLLARLLLGLCLREKVNAHCESCLPGGYDVFSKPRVCHNVSRMRATVPHADVGKLHACALDPAPVDLAVVFRYVNAQLREELTVLDVGKVAILCAETSPSVWREVHCGRVGDCH